MADEYFFGQCINWLDDERNIAIWDNWNLQIELGDTEMVKGDINSFFRARALMEGYSFTEKEFKELTDHMWAVLTFAE